MVAPRKTLPGLWDALGLGGYFDQMEPEPETGYDWKQGAANAAAAASDPNASAIQVLTAALSGGEKEPSKQPPPVPPDPGAPPLELPAAQLQAEARARRGFSPEFAATNAASAGMYRPSGGFMPESLTRLPLAAPGMGMSAEGMPDSFFPESLLRPPELAQGGFRPNRSAYDMLPGPDMILREPTAGYGRRSSRW